MKAKKPLIITTLLLAICLLCALTTQLFSGVKIEKNDKLHITASFYPVYIAAMNVTSGADVTLTNLVGNAAGCPHDYQMTPKDMTMLEKSDILVINGGGMEEFLEKPIASFSHLQVVDIGEGLSIEEDSHEHEHENENEHEHEEDDCDYEHTHEHSNGHIWVDPSLYIKQIEHLSESLSRLDPKNSTIYKNNAATYIERLTPLMAELEDAASSLENKNVIIFHDSLEYFCQFTGLNILKVVEIEGDVQPSAKDIAECVNIAQNQNAGLILCEKQYANSAARSVANESGLPLVILDSSVTGEDDINSYISILEKNIQVLREAA